MEKTNIYTINLTKRNTKNLSIMCIFGIGHSCYGQLTAVTKKSIHWPESSDNIASSGVACFSQKLTAAKVLVFDLIAYSSQVTTLALRVG